MKAEAAERKAKAAAPSKRKREAAALVAQHAALVAVADAIPKVLTGTAAWAESPSNLAPLELLWLACMLHKKVADYRCRRC